MRERFLFSWADGKDSAGQDLRRVPTNAEIAAGYPCGPADKPLHNEVTARGLMAANELGYLVEVNDLAFDEDDQTQVYQAVIRTHLIPEDMTLYVPAQYPTLQAARQYLLRYRIAGDANVRIQLGAGDFPIDISTGPLFLDHPDGGRIEIVGQPLTGTGFPTPTEVDLPNKSTVEQLIRQRFPTRIVLTGAVPGFFLLSGTIKRIKDLAFIGDGTPNQDGIRIGEWVGQIGSGNIKLENVWAHNIGGNGMRANYNAAIAGQNLGATYCGGSGFLAANLSGIQVSGSFIAVRNVVAGIAARDTSFIEGVTNSECYFNRNGIGIITQDIGNAKFRDAARLEIKNNASYGCLNANHSLFSVPALVTGGGNGGVDVQSDVGSTGVIPTGTALTMSPAANTVGNNNSYNRVA